MPPELPTEATTEPPPELGTLPQPHGNQTHGLRSKKPIIRALLCPAEAEAWDLAPVPHDCSEVLEEIFREYYVLKYRVHAWEHDQAPIKAVEALQARLRLLHIPLRGLLKSVEVHARIKETEQTHDMGDAVLAYLRTLPAQRLETYLTEGEAPRFDPATGRLLTDVSRETGGKNDLDHNPAPGFKGAPDSDGTPSAPDPGWAVPRGGPEGD